MKLITVFPVLIFLINETLGIYLDGIENIGNDNIVLQNVEDNRIIYHKRKRKGGKPKIRVHRPYLKPYHPVDSITLDTGEPESERVKPKRRVRPYLTPYHPVDSITLDIGETKSGRVKPKRRVGPYLKPYHPVNSIILDIGQTESKRVKPRRLVLPYLKPYDPVDGITLGIGEGESEGVKPKRRVRQYRTPYHPVYSATLDIGESESVKPKRRVRPSYRTPYHPVDSATLDIGEREYERDRGGESEIEGLRRPYRKHNRLTPRRFLNPLITTYDGEREPERKRQWDRRDREGEIEEESGRISEKPRRRLRVHSKPNNFLHGRRLDVIPTDSRESEIEREGEREEKRQKSKRRLHPYRKHLSRRHGDNFSTSYQRSFNRGAEAFTMSHGSSFKDFD